MRRLLLVLSMLLAIVGRSHAAEYAAMSGEELYLRFCASCHGTSGAGDGPVAGSFKVEVPDLRLMTRRAGGVYPRDRIVRIIDGRHIFAAHGARTMPVWGEDLSRVYAGNPEGERATQGVIYKLADYVARLQRPPVQ
jgi:mono/diheme cytochrome c family protein